MRGRLKLAVGAPLCLRRPPTWNFLAGCCGHTTSGDLETLYIVHTLWRVDGPREAPTRRPMQGNLQQHPSSPGRPPAIAASPCSDAAGHHAHLLSRCGRIVGTYAATICSSEKPMPRRERSNNGPVRNDGRQHPVILGGPLTSPPPPHLLSLRRGRHAQTTVATLPLPAFTYSALKPAPIHLNRLLWAAVAAASVRVWEAHYRSRCRVVDYVSI